MSDKLNITIGSYASGVLNSLEMALADHEGIVLERFLVSENQTALLDQELESCDVLVLGLSEDWEKLLALVGNIPLVVVGPSDNPDMMRLSFKAGAVDYLYEPADAEELRAAIDNAHQDKQIVPPANEGDVTVFVAPKGGAGATTLAVHLSHILSTRSYQPEVLLIDFDLQYGNLPLHFNQKPSTKLSTALSRGERIDATLFDACVSRVENNMHIMATHSKQLLSPWETDVPAVTSLLNFARQRYDHVLIDVPHSVDPVTFSALELADRILIVVQQTLSDMHMAHQYVRLLHEQGIASDSISIVVNRYEKANVIQLEDFEHAFNGQDVHGVPNDYKRVTFSTQNSVPLIGKWRNSMITKNLVKFAQHHWPDQSEPRRWSFSYSRESDKAA